MAQQLAGAALDWVAPVGTLFAVIDAELLPHRWSSRTQPVAAPLVRGPSADVNPLPVIQFFRYKGSCNYFLISSFPAERIG